MANDTLSSHPEDPGRLVVFSIEEYTELGIDVSPGSFGRRMLDLINDVPAWLDERWVPTDWQPLQRCVVAACCVRSRRLTSDGMCPPRLWDLRHDEFARELSQRELRVLELLQYQGASSLARAA